MSNELLQSFQPDYLLYTHILVIATSFRIVSPARIWATIKSNVSPLSLNYTASLRSSVYSFEPSEY